MDKIVVKKSHTGLTKYGYLYEYHIESDINGIQKITDKCDYTFMQGETILIRITNLLYEKDGLYNCINNFHTNFLKINGDMCGGYASHNTIPNPNMVDMPVEKQISKIEDVYLDLKPNCKIKVQIWISERREYEVDKMTHIYIHRDIKIDDFLFEKGTNVWKIYEEHNIEKVIKYPIIRYSNFDKGIYRIAIIFDSEKDMDKFFDKLICINCQQK